MDINLIVELVQLATTENARKLQATQFLDQLRVSPDRWNVGLRLFSEISNDMVRFFGLSLIRDWMQNELPNASSAGGYHQARHEIRSTLMSWLVRLLQEMSGGEGSNVPFFLLSNVITVFTLSIKFDFPSEWPSAFSELLQLGYTHGIPGIDIVTRVLKELDVEVVMFSETRSREEIALNTVVKDAMRESSVMTDIVKFLGQSAQHTLSAQRLEICTACVQSVAVLVPWIDIVLVLELVLAPVYQMWQCPHAVIRAASLLCLFEMMKKGMDPVAKVRLLVGIGLVGHLVQDQHLQALLTRSHTQSIDEEEEKELQQAGALVDMIVQGLFGYWSKYEDLACGKNKSASLGEDSEDLLTSLPVVVQFLQQLLPLLLQVFGHGSLKVSSTALPSCSRLVAILRSQQQRAAQLQALSSKYSSTEGAANSIFRAEDYLYPLLSAVYTKSQFPVGFDFEAALEDEMDEETEDSGNVECPSFRGSHSWLSLADGHSVA